MFYTMFTNRSKHTHTNIQGALLCFACIASNHDMMACLRCLHCLLALSSQGSNSYHPSSLSCPMLVHWCTTNHHRGSPMTSGASTRVDSMAIQCHLVTEPPVWWEHTQAASVQVLCFALFCFALHRFALLCFALLCIYSLYFVTCTRNVGIIYISETT